MKSDAILLDHQVGAFIGQRRRQSIWPVKNKWWCAGMVICLEQGANDCVWSSWCRCHPVICCFIKMQTGLTFLAPVYPGCPGKEAFNRCLSTVLFVFKQETWKLSGKWKLNEQLNSESHWKWNKTNTVVCCFITIMSFYSQSTSKAHISVASCYRNWCLGNWLVRSVNFMQWNRIFYTVYFMLPNLQSQCTEEYYYPFNSLSSRTTWVSLHEKGKPFWILLEQEMMGWQCWTICKSFASRSRQITTPASHH